MGCASTKKVPEVPSSGQKPEELPVQGTGALPIALTEAQSSPREDILVPKEKELGAAETSPSSPQNDTEPQESQTTPHDNASPSVANPNDEVRANDEKPEAGGANVPSPVKTEAERSVAFEQDFEDVKSLNSSVEKDSSKVMSQAEESSRIGDTSIGSGAESSFKDVQVDSSAQMETSGEFADAHDNDDEATIYDSDEEEEEESANQTSHAVEYDETQKQHMMNAQQGLVKGLSYIDDGQIEDAITAFNEAISESQLSGNVKLQARTTAGLATAYSRSNNAALQKLAPNFYEISASLFLSINEMDQYIDVIRGARDSYMVMGQKDQAIKLLERVNALMAKEGRPTVFSKDINEINAGKVPAGAKRGWF